MVASFQTRAFNHTGSLAVLAALVVFGLAGGSFIFLGFVVVTFFAVVFGFYAIRGSGINKHPSDGLDGSPGSEGPSEASGKGRSHGTTSEGHSAGDTFSTHGHRVSGAAAVTLPPVPVAHRPVR